ncbi:MAG: hypothetical protein WCD43_01395 [Candidatus Acidiferrales bacterium]
MTQADYIPFINSETDCIIATQLYSDAGVMRVSLESIDKIGSNLPSGPKRWVDAAIDGLHHKDLLKLSGGYQDHLKKFTGYASINDPQFQKSPSKNVTDQFAASVLEHCKAQAADWISIPQLPMVNDTARNKINKFLAEGAQNWKRSTGYPGKLILPVIFTDQRQLNKKTERNKKIISIAACYAAGAADGVWAADSTLNDQKGSGKFDERFPALRKFHEELNEQLPENAITVCGPYWGMNLICWVQNCVRFPAIGLGGSYKYNIPGPILNRSNKRLPLRPLRRWANASPQLKVWLASTVAALSASDPAKADFAALEKEFSKFQVVRYGKMQIASFYKDWFDRIATLPPAGRALALYQDLSSAYVLGKTLEALPAEEETARRPERVAQQLMMNCL